MIELILSFFFATGIAAGALKVPGESAERAVVVLPIVLVLMRIFHATSVGRIANAAKRAGAKVGRRLTLEAVFMSSVNLAAFAAILHFGWTDTVRRLPYAERWSLLALSALLLPWLVLEFSWLWSRAALHNRLRAREWPRAAFLSTHMRFLLLPAMPVILQCAIQDLLAYVPGYVLAVRGFPSLEIAIQLVAVVLLFIFSPFVFRAAVASSSLPAGPLRSRLEELANRARIRCLDIRLVHTRGNIINAAFIGVFGRLRYVFLTDGILETLAQDDLTGVFAHELGHSQRRHLLYNLALFCTFIIIGHVVTTQFLPMPEITSGLVSLAGFIAFFLWVFSPIAKRFETEADVYAGELVGDPGPIVRSLSALGWQFPDRLHQGGFIHPSLSERVDYLGRHFGDKETASWFRASMARTKTSIIVFFVMTLILWLTILPGEIITGRWTGRIASAAAAENGPQARTILSELDKRWPMFLDDEGFTLRMTLWQTAILADQKDGRYVEAEPLLTLVQAERARFTDPALRYNAANLACYQAAATGDWVSLATELPEALRLLSELTPYYEPDHPEMLRETADNELMLRALLHLARQGIIIPHELPAPTGAPLTDPAADALTRLIELPNPAKPADLKQAVTLPDDTRRWKRDFLDRLAAVLAKP